MAIKHKMKSNQNLKRITRRFPGLILFLIALVIRFLFFIFPQFYEQIYFNGLFPIIRKLQSLLSFVWIIPGYFVLLVELIAWLIWRFPKKHILLFLRRLLNLASTIGALFLILWGFNYVDKGFAHRMQLPITDEKVEISQFYIAAMDSAMHYRNKIDEDFDTITNVQNIPTDKIIASWVANELKNYGYPTNSSIRVRHIRPSGSLLRLSIAGIYNPFTGEANIDNALPSLPQIFTTAHEIAHAYGITGEAEANFVAFLACINSENPLAQYAGFYALWRQIAAEINKTYTPEELEYLAAQIPLQLKTDREAIIAAQYQYRGYFPAVSEAINDTYLKVQGVEKGAADYDGFLQLYLRWILQNESESAPAIHP